MDFQIKYSEYYFWIIVNPGGLKELLAIIKFLEAVS